MATKKKPQAPAAAKKPAKKEKLAPLPCKCGRPAVPLKIGKLWRVYCPNAYCDEGPRNVRGTTEAEAVKKWNEEVAKK